MLADALRVDYQEKGAKKTAPEDEVFDLSDASTIAMLKKIAQAGR